MLENVVCFQNSDFIILLVLLNNYYNQTSFEIAKTQQLIELGKLEIFMSILFA